MHFLDRVVDRLGLDGRLPLDATRTISVREAVRACHSAGRPAVSLAWFVRRMWPVLEPSTPLTWGWSLDVLTSRVQAQLLGELPTRDLSISIPPGHMKSLVVGVFAPAWAWTYRPSLRIIAASGTPSVVSRDSLRCRALLQSDEYRELFTPSWRLLPDNNTKTLFENTSRGYRQGIGAGASVTGSRADWLVVDDPNSAADVWSEVERTRINESWWRDAFSNRVSDPKTAMRTLIMQRLHERDLAGYIRDTEGDTWTRLVLRTEAEADDPERAPEDTRKPGELLFPERFPRAYIETEKRKGSFYWASQHQQRPASVEGGMFRLGNWGWWARDGMAQPRPRGASAVAPERWAPELDPRQSQLRGTVTLMQSVDATFRRGDGRGEVDNVAIIMAAMVGPKCYVLEVDARPGSFSETLERIRAMRARWPDCHTTLIEAKANGDAIIDTLRTELTGVVGVDPLGGKEARAAAISAQVEGGQVLLHEGAAWVDAWCTEFASFPRGRHDDRVDALSQLLLYAREGTAEVRALNAWANF